MGRGCCTWRARVWSGAIIKRIAVISARALHRECRFPGGLSIVNADHYPTLCALLWHPRHTHGQQWPHSAGGKFRIGCISFILSPDSMGGHWQSGASAPILANLCHVYLMLGSLLCLIVLYGYYSRNWKHHSRCRFVSYWKDRCSSLIHIHEYKNMVVAFSFICMICN